MTPEQALQILDQVVADMDFTRAKHVRLQEAVNVLMVVVERLKAHTDGEPKAEGEKENG